MRLKVRYLVAGDPVQQQVENFLDEWYSEQAIVHVRTSGSTGKPKTIELSKEKMRASAQMTGEFLDLKCGDKALLCLSPSTIGGKMMIVRAIELKMELLVAPVCSDPLLVLNESIDFIAMVPMQLSNSIESSAEKIRTIRQVIIGGGVVSQQLSEKLRDLKLTIYQTYGMTETISHVAMRKIGYQEETFYTAVGNYTFSQKENCLSVHSLLLDGGTIDTNDIVQLIDNKHFEWIGRRDFVINSGGIKIHPEMVEKKLETYIKSPFFIGAIPDDYLGEKVVLCIESPVQLPLTKEGLRKYISAYECPKIIYYIPQFVRTASGKINRRESLEKAINNSKSFLLL